MQPTKPAAFAYRSCNYRLIRLGLAVLAAGFITMTFGEKENYGEDFVGITLGPLLLVLGFAIEFAAIMVRDKSLHTAPATIESTSLSTPDAPAPATPAPA